MTKSTKKAGFELDIPRPLTKVIVLSLTKLSLFPRTRGTWDTNAYISVQQEKERIYQRFFEKAHEDSD